MSGSRAFIAAFAVALSLASAGQPPRTTRGSWSTTLW